MSQEAAEKWNNRYSGEIKPGLKTPRQLLIDYQDILPIQGRAVDIAMGLGNNANYIQKRGIDVIGIDISFKAALMAKQNFPNLSIIVANLEEFDLSSQTFDLILNFYYFQRNLVQQYPLMLNPGGLLFVETLHEDFLSIKPEINRDYLVSKGELAETFSNLEILHYFEGWLPTHSNKQKYVAQVVARKKQ